MSKKEVHMAYHGILQTKIGYALAVTTFTEKELKKIQRAADIAYKPKIGLNRNFPSAVLQGPNDFCGLAHPPFYTQQGFKQLQMLLGTIRNKDDTGDYIKASLELEQQESGYTTPILSVETPITYQAWAPKTWVGSVKRFLHTMSAETKLYNQWCPTEQRTDDTSLMTAFEARFTKPKIKTSTT